MENKAIYQRFIEEAFNKGNDSVIDEIVAPDYVLHGAPPGMPQGPGAIRASISAFRTAFPDLHIELVALVAEGDTVSARSVMTGTHEGVLFGTPPTHRKVSVEGLTMVTIKDGRLRESWVKNDVLDMYRQLGVDPPKA